MNLTSCLLYDGEAVAAVELPLSQNPSDPSVGSSGCLDALLKLFKK